MTMLSFVKKEVVEIVRRPGVLVSLILGPFLIMALFGAGYSGQRKPLDTVVVVPAGANLPTDQAFYEELTGPNINVVEVSQDPESARARLHRQQIQLVIVAPENAEERFRAGEQSVIGLEYNSINPVDNVFTQIVAEQEVSSLNQALVEQMAATGQTYMVQTTGAQEATEIPPEVVARPTRAELENVAPSQPTVTEFYAPAVLALVLQHMGVTLAALSIVRERLSGAMDLFRVAPIGTLGILLGKYFAFGFLNAVIATAVTLLVVFALGVPMLGNILQFVQVVALLSFASLGLGLFISAVADSERQAVQLSMLVLLASVFMSGFVLPLEEFDPPIQWVGYLLPVTHGIRLLQDIMLRGGTFAVWQFWALLAFGVAMFVLSAISLRRNLAGS
jgi:ABC-2 type transport system permease protein